MGQGLSLHPASAAIVVYADDEFYAGFVNWAVFTGYRLDARVIFPRFAGA
jgi:hypothetical protein